MEALAPRLDIRILGTLSVRAEGADLELGSTKQRRVLALLLMRANRAVSVSEIIDVVWPEDPPRTARKNLQVYVCGLRKALPGRIRYDGSGYAITTAAACLDLLRFDELTAAGRRAARNGDASAAAELLGSAVLLWDGEPAAGLWEPGEAPGDVTRLQDRYLAAYEDWIDATISVGCHLEALEHLDVIEESTGFRERLVISRMRALSLCGRTLDALACYEDKRQYLAKEYGIDPSPVLQSMYVGLLSPRPNGASFMYPNAQSHVISTATHQLPRDIPDLVGREEPQRQILENPAGITVIWGRIGAGKTSLAVHAAHLIGSDYPDGNLFIRSHASDGQPKDPATAVRELLRAVGLSSAIPDDPEAATALWRAWTTRRKLLLVLDDAPDEDYVDALVPSSPDSLVIVTSRSRLSGLEADLWIELGDLSERAAAKLLGRLIGAARVEHEYAAITQIIKCCGSSPLAIRVIGGKLAPLAHLSLTEFADRLSSADPFAELVSGQASVEERYARWYQELPEESKAAARCLAELSPGPFTHIEACQALAFAGFAPDRAFELLFELSMLSTSEQFDEVTAHAVADVTLHAEMYEMPPLMRRFLLRGEIQ
jgi:DNA-binding SARP family transcriptional activator